MFVIVLYDFYAKWPENFILRINGQRVCAYGACFAALFSGSTVPFPAFLGL